MKVAVLAALSVLIAIPSAEAGQGHVQKGSPVTSCDNDGHCTTRAATLPVASPRKGRPEIKKTTATARTQSAALDANGNTMGVIVSAKTGARARVGVAYAARFQAYIDDLETNHGARVLFMGGIRPGHCSPSSEHPCGKALDVCQLRRGVVDSRCNLPGRRGARRDRRFARSVRRRALVQFRLWSCADRCNRRGLRRPDPHRTPVKRRLPRAHRLDRTG